MLQLYWPLNSTDRWSSGFPAPQCRAHWVPASCPAMTRPSLSVGGHQNTDRISTYLCRPAKEVLRFGGSEAGLQSLRGRTQSKYVTPPSLWEVRAGERVDEQLRPYLLDWVPLRSPIQMSPLVLAGPYLSICIQSSEQPELLGNFPREAPVSQIISVYVFAGFPWNRCELYLFTWQIALLCLLLTMSVMALVI